jgi:hypothetical protein
MNHRHLEDWAHRAAQQLADTLQELRDAGDIDPAPEEALLDEYDAICAGRDPWTLRVREEAHAKTLLDEL